MDGEREFLYEVIVLTWRRGELEQEIVFKRRSPNHFRDSFEFLSIYGGELDTSTTTWLKMRKVGQTRQP